MDGGYVGRTVMVTVEGESVELSVLARDPDGRYRCEVMAIGIQRPMTIHIEAKQVARAMATGRLFAAA